MGIEGGHRGCRRTSPHRSRHTVYEVEVDPVTWIGVGKDSYVLEDPRRRCDGWCYRWIVGWGAMLMQDEHTGRG